MSVRSGAQHLTDRDNRALHLRHRQPYDAGHGDNDIHSCNTAPPKRKGGWHLGECTMPRVVFVLKVWLQSRLGDHAECLTADSLTCTYDPPSRTLSVSR